jgi:uncharacterized spore protein YtfJ
MEGGGTPVRWGPFRLKTVRGEPYLVGGRKIVPVVRILSSGRARATIGTRGVSGRGAGFVWIKPVAVIEETPDGERRIPITDGTGATVRALLGGALGLALCCAALRRWARRRQRVGPAG